MVGIARGVVLLVVDRATLLLRLQINRADARLLLLEGLLFGAFQRCYALFVMATSAASST